MEYNKKHLTKLNDRKILHKVRKHWVIVSLALLGVIGGGAITHVKASANVSPARFMNGFGRQTNAASANQNVALTSNHVSQSASSQLLASHSQASVSQQATNLHDRIITRAAMNQSTRPNNSTTSSNVLSRSAQQRSLINSVTVQESRTPQIQTEKWGRTQIKFVSDGNHGDAGGDVAIVEPGAISDAFYEQNNSDTTYNSDHSNGVKGCYIVNRYNDDLQLPFDQASNNWSLKFAPGVFLPQGDGVSKNDQAPKSDESTSDVDYTQGAVKTNDYRYLFSSTNRSLWNHFKTMDLTNLDTDNAKDLSNMFTGDQSLQKVILNDSNNPNLTELHGMFADDPQLREVDFNHFNTGNVTDLDSMFMSDIRLQHLNLNELDTHNVTNMHAMFMSDLDLYDLQGIDQLNTGRVTNMISMFSRDQSLPQLHLDHWNTSNVTSMAEMFSGDTNLHDLDLSGFDTDHVSDMSSMFTQDNRLQSLNLANFDTRNVHAIFPGASIGGMSFMFSGDNHLNKLVLGSYTNLDGPNQNWNSPFFNQIFNVNGNDVTAALKSGRQPADIYYSANYYNHVLLVQQYFAKESEIDDQILSNADIQEDPQARAQVQQSINQADELEKGADEKLNTASVNSQVLNDINSVSNLTSSANDQISSATQWLVSSSSSNATSLSNYQASIARSASVSASRSASVSASDSLKASTAASLRSSEVAVSNASAMKQLNDYINELTTDDQTVVDRDGRALSSLSNLRPLDQIIQSADNYDTNEIVNNQNATDSIEESAKAAVSEANSQQSTDLEPLITNVKKGVNASRNYSQQAGSILNHDVSSLASMNDSVSVSVSASISANASKSAILSASTSTSESISASVSASLSTSASLSNRNISSVSAPASGIIRNDINKINSYDQLAQQDDDLALSDLNQINVSSNASLSALKNNDVSETYDDEDIISEENSLANSFNGELRNGSYEPSPTVNNASSQVTAASNIAQDARLIIRDDIRALKAAFNQARSPRSNSNHSISSSANSNPITSSAKSTINMDRTYFNIYSGQIKSTINDPEIRSNVLASSQISNDNKIASSANQMLFHDQLSPDMINVNNANEELSSAMSADENAQQVVSSVMSSSISVSAADHNDSSRNMTSNNSSSNISDNVKPQNSASSGNNLFNNGNFTSNANNTTPSQNNGRQSTSSNVSSVSSNANPSKHDNDSSVNDNGATNNSAENNHVGSDDNSNDTTDDNYNNGNIGKGVQQSTGDNSNVDNLPQTGESANNKAIAISLLAIVADIGILGALVNRKRRYNQ